MTIPPISVHDQLDKMLRAAGEEWKKLQPQNINDSRKLERVLDKIELRFLQPMNDILTAAQKLQQHERQPDSAALLHPPLFSRLSSSIDAANSFFDEYDFQRDRCEKSDGCVSLPQKEQQQQHPPPSALILASSQDVQNLCDKLHRAVQEQESTAVSDECEEQVALLLPRVAERVRALEPQHKQYCEAAAALESGEKFLAEANAKWQKQQQVPVQQTLDSCSVDADDYGL